ncbi:hypothetical protein BB559_003261 [Furculomyces boomerangus]|uniref:Uncharacterized protein n=2 Tax=Harpellales TaxID=61421 RepID=A0A2T9YMB6_9FUNG|nr:hypothetical protein BB559_003261 [Furculomyces boomerangus]PVZ99769.1 hypothetical protein BB558_004184 [Smittium angustum]
MNPAFRAKVKPGAAIVYLENDKLYFCSNDSFVDTTGFDNKELDNYNIYVSGDKRTCDKVSPPLNSANAFTANWKLVVPLLLSVLVASQIQSYALETNTK